MALRGSPARRRVRAHLVLRVGKSDIPSATSGVLGALGSAVAHYSGQVRIQIETEDLPGHFVHDSNPLLSVEADKKLARWKGYLESWYATSPTGLARDIVDGEHSDSLRLYPQLSKNPSNAGWSLRLDGLQVGVVNNDSGWLRVGKSLTAQRAVQAWGQVRPGGYGTEPLECVRGGRNQGEHPHPTVGRPSWSQRGLVDHGQSEHSLESAILRGVVPVLADGTRLGLPRETDGRQQRIAWGSQVPTLWWHGGSARYLDALMKDGATPWAVEIKVAEAGGGYGRYLRQGLTQAILYRHFLLAAHQYEAWFTSLGMDRSACRAALLYPQPTPQVAVKVEHKVAALDQLCRDFAVTPIRVDVPELH